MAVATPARIPNLEGTFSMPSSHSPAGSRSPSMTTTRSPTLGCCCPPPWPTGSASRRSPVSWSTLATVPAITALAARCSPCCTAHRMAAGIVPSPTATASPRSSTWRGPPPRGGCCAPRSLAVARRRPAGVSSPSGPRPGCSMPSTSRFGPAGDGGAGGLVAGEPGHGQRARQAWGTMWAQIRSIVASLGPSSTGSVTVGGCR
jgi:hypothetical protein